MAFSADGDSGRSADLAGNQFAWRWVWLTLVTGLSIGVALTLLLWGHTTAEHTDAFDAGWRGAAAVLAILASFLTVSRLRLSQREHQRQLVADDAAYRDATARQITELATRASEQLGAANSATRIGGLASLERLAQSHPELRQTVVDQICSYLRRPYQPPPKRIRALPRDTTPVVVPNGVQDSAVDDRLELDVRRTAQEILRRHSVWPTSFADRPETFWAKMVVDLRDAVLVDFDLGHCRLGFVDFADADLYGITTFTETVFTAGARFDDVRFGGETSFRGARFHQLVRFDDATFGGAVSFVEAEFMGNASFERAIFLARADFGGGHYFLGGGCHHHGDVKVEDAGAVFRGFGSFQEAVFRGTADFAETTFEGPAYFQHATFAAAANFDQANFTYASRQTMTAWRSDNPGKTVTIDMSYAFMFHDVRVLEPSWHNSWPSGWQLQPVQDDDAARLYFLLEP